MAAEQLFDDPPSAVFYTVRFYRSQPGDAGFKNLILPEGFSENDIAEPLLDRFKRPEPKRRPPTQADILDENGKVVCRFRVSGDDRVDCLPDTSSPPTKWRVQRAPRNRQ